MLMGASLSAFFLALASGADLKTHDPVDWGSRIFGVFMGSAGFGTLLLGCIFLWHHWIEAISDLRERPADLFRQFTRRPEGSERERLAPMRSGLLLKSLLGFAAILLASWLAARFGIVPERLLDNPLLRAIYSDILWIFILTFVVVLWTTRRRIAAVLRVGVLLVFSLIILSATIFFVYWIASGSAPAIVAFCTGIVLVNFVFYYRLERTATSSCSAASTIE
jgi:hypothetical protein